MRQWPHAVSYHTECWEGGSDELESTTVLRGFLCTLHGCKMQAEPQLALALQNVLDMEGPGLPGGTITHFYIQAAGATAWASEGQGTLGSQGITAEFV